MSFRRCVLVSLFGALAGCTVGTDGPVEVGVEDVPEQVQQARDAWLEEGSVDGVLQVPVEEGDVAYDSSSCGDSWTDHYGWGVCYVDVTCDNGHGWWVRECYWDYDDDGDYDMFYPEWDETVCDCILL